MRRLAGIATTCGAAICASGVSAPPAPAERPLGRAMARAARTLTAIIRRDARQIARARATGAVLARRCCSTRTLSVYYRSPPSVYLPWYGAYDLKLATRRRFLTSVTVSYFPTQSSWTYGAAAHGQGPSYSFTIRSPNRRRGWHFEASNSLFGCGEARPARGTCEGLSQAVGFDERQGGERQFRRLFRQAESVTGKARRHKPISGENLFAAR